MIDPRDVWKSQPTEPFRISAEEMRRRAQRLQAKGRLGALTWMTIGPALGVTFAWALVREHTATARIGWGVLSLWGFHGIWRGYRWFWPAKLPPDATVGTSLEFYRGELERQRDYLQHIWRRAGLTYCFAGLAIVLVPAMIKLFATPGRTMRAVAPFFTLLAIWLALFFPLRRRNQRKLQEEIEELRAFERERQ